ncbi:zinc-dependent alcohol dehydrogenase [Propionivibrio sp.]|uniref:zinc-dependent alcohol dehydrogenase n=1 Tax=Propionivibrio sp. TaxID=2212460 RepID=UPI00272E880D|nr:alcohol dehydrogenase catalytic domain-containing protein [Propionivibrio sp.]
MLQVKMTEAFKMSFLDTPVPEVGDDEVLIQMKRVGVCGSDIQIYHGKHKYMTFPVVQGHEGAGVVTKVGSKVSGFKEGDKVTIQPQVYCGTCAPCRSGHYNVCKNLKVYGVHTGGMFSEYFAVPASKALLLPENMSFDEGSLVEPAAVATGAIRRCGNLTGTNVVVLGAGTIGNLVAQVAVASGAKKVVITDINETRLDIARTCGIHACINTRGRKLKDVILEQFGDDEADIIIDCAGVKAIFSEAVAAARCSSKLVIVANYKEPVEVELPLFQRREVDMLGIMMYLREDFQRAIDLMTSKAINTAPLISDHFGIRQLEEVYPYIDNNPESVMKVVIDISAT